METVRIGGLRNALVRQQTKPETEKKASVDEASSNLKDIEVSSAKSLVKAYVKIAEQNKQRSLAAFFADPLLEVNDAQIVFTVGSKTVAQEIENEAEKLKQTAAKQGYAIRGIRAQVNAVKVSEYKIFTPKQQFDVMAKTNPVLKDFESRFNLTFDE